MQKYFRFINWVTEKQLNIFLSLRKFFQKMAPFNQQNRPVTAATRRRMTDVGELRSIEWVTGRRWIWGAGR